MAAASAELNPAGKNNLILKKAVFSNNLSLISVQDSQTVKDMNHILKSASV